MLRHCGFYARVSVRAFRYVLTKLILTPFVSAKAVSYRGGDTSGVILFVGVEIWFAIGAVKR